jgi:PAS domain S-box-containing protein
MKDENKTKKELVEELTGLRRDMAELKRSQAVESPLGDRPLERIKRLKRVAELSMNIAGDPMAVFEQISRIIAELLDVPVVCLSEIRGTELYFLSVYVEGKVMVDAGHCPLDITPCATVQQTKDIRIYDKVFEQFPEAAFLKAHNAYSYCGFPSLDGSGNVVAVTCLLDSKPHDFSDEDKYLLDILGQRIAFELERKKHLVKSKRADEALERSEERFALAMRGANDGLWDRDLRTNDVYFSPRWKSMLGYAENELENTFETWEKLIHPDDLGRAKRRIDEHLAGRTPGYEVEFRMRHKKGDWLHILSRGFALRRESDSMPVRLVGTHVDITERKQAEEALKRERDYLEKLHNSLGEAVFTVKMPERVVEFVNLAAEEMFGYSPDECIGRKTEMFYPEGGSADFGRKIKAAIDKGDDVVRTEQDLRRKDGEVFPAGITTTFLREDGAVSKVISIVQDITRRKRMEDELLKTRKLESLGVLAGGIAHDFNNLLTGITGNLSLVKQYTDRNNKNYKRLVELDKAAIHAKELTQQLLTFSKGGKPIKEAISIGNLLEESAVFALRGSNVRCDFFVPPGLWPVEADAGQMTQVISNLVINANQAMPKGGVVKVMAGNITLGAKDNPPLKKGRYVKVSIEDQGVGIPEEHLQKVFDPYFTTKEKGSGLGLSSVYSIIKKHEGHIEVTSMLGGGTTFNIFLPATSKEVHKKADEAEVLMEGRGKILVMDDEEIIRDVVGDILSNLGYEVDCAVEGNEAVELYRLAKESGKPFDAVIMDLTIAGGLGGKEAIEKLLDIDPGARVIVSSGYSNDPIMSDYKKYGFSGVIAKPYKAAELSAKVHKVIFGED